MLLDDDNKPSGNARKNEVAIISDVTDDSGGVRSMTGQGAGQCPHALGVVAVEIRAVNQRGLKISPRLSDTLAPLESRFEQWIRLRIRRGTLQANAHFTPTGTVTPGEINVPVVSAYLRQLQAVKNSVGLESSIELTGLLELPGAVVYGGAKSLDAEALWPALVTATDQAIDGLDAMRITEGGAMAGALRSDAAAIYDQLAEVALLAPRVVDNYRARLEAKIRRVMDEHGLEFAASDLLRDVHLYADRSDISEEITRLGSHLSLFEETLSASDASGRKLDFIVQEMFRETNTIGSKAADAEISARIVDVKCAIERMRELVQNIQ